MVTLSRYWMIWRINPAAGQGGYKTLSLSAAKTFFDRQIRELEREGHANDSQKQNQLIQADLFCRFRQRNPATDTLELAFAGLCLRCYVSYPILKACKKLASLFGSCNLFTYQDLLPLVLNDDGERLVILDQDGKTQLSLDSQGNQQTMLESLFTVEILKTFQPDSPSSMSLDNWAFWHTKQHSKLKGFLSEFGFQNLSDWALMNRAGTTQLDCLSQSDRHYIEVFQSVYRRDRRQQPRQQGRCPDPSTAQLQEMLALLSRRGIYLNTPSTLMRELKRVAQLLSQYDIWSRRGTPLAQPLEVFDPDLGDFVTRELPDRSIFNDLDELEQQDFYEFLHQQFFKILAEAIGQEIEAHLTYVQNSRNYAPLAHKVIPGLQLYYVHNKSLREIAALLDMNNWDRARRVLNPGEILSKVRSRTLQQLISRLLEKAEELGLATSESNYLSNITQAVEEFIDAETFTEAAAESRAGNNRLMNSLYAQQMRLHLDTYAGEPKK